MPNPNKTKLLSSITLKKMIELSNIDNNAHRVPADNTKRLVSNARYSGTFIKKNKNNLLMGYASKERAIYTKDRRQNIAVFLIGNYKVSPLSLNARCIECYVENDPNEDAFIFVLPFKPQFNEAGDPDLPREVLSKVEIKIPHSSIQSFDCNLEHVFLNLDTSIQREWINFLDPLNVNQKKLTLSKDQSSYVRLNEEEAEEGKDLIINTVRNDTVIKLIMIKPNFSWISYLLSVNIPSLIEKFHIFGGSKNHIRKNIKDKMGDGVPHVRVNRNRSVAAKKRALVRCQVKKQADDCILFYVGEREHFAEGGKMYYVKCHEADLKMKANYEHIRCLLETPRYRGKKIVVHYSQKIKDCIDSKAT
uniref:SET domain-containing protein n=1 Tax=Rhabditophanes sp. KR3021 TaxID=114890 RepID=A0AC35U2W8_9BILA